MFKSIRNITSAVTDITTIAVKEVTHQIDSANECCTDITRNIAWRASQIRKEYEERLANRRRKTLMIEHIQQGQQK
jgi:transcriptional regulator GlxA family with amidase domain